MRDELAYTSAFNFVIALHNPFFDDIRLAAFPFTVGMSLRLGCILGTFFASFLLLIVMLVLAVLVLAPAVPPAVCFGGLLAADSCAPPCDGKVTPAPMSIVACVALECITNFSGNLRNSLLHKGKRCIAPQTSLLVIKSQKLHLKNCVREPDFNQNRLVSESRRARIIRNTSNTKFTKSTESMFNEGQVYKCML